MKQRKNAMRKVRLIGSTCLCLCLPGLVHAQADVAGSNSDTGFTGGFLEEITVTARRVEEGLQDTPISITAVTSSDLKARNIDRLDEISNFTPNVTITPGMTLSGNSASASFFIRGIGQPDFLLTTDPGVGLYVDGVYVPRSIGSLLDLVDVEQVEILRGPQGTLFGRNTIGGAISVTTAKPSSELGGSASVSIGRYDRREVKASLNLPVTDTLFLRVSGARQKKDEYVKNLLPGEPGGGDVDATSGRLALRFVPTDRLTVDLTADFTRRRELPAPYVLAEVNDMAAFNLAWNGMVGGTCSPPPPDTTNPACQSSYYIAGPYTTYSVYRSPSAVANNAAIPFEPESNTDVYGFSGTIEYDFGPFSAKYIGAYRDVEASYPRDAGHSPHFVLKSMNAYKYDQSSHELQLGGAAFDGAMQWLLGAYYATESGEHRDVTSMFLVDFLSGGFVDNKSLAFFGQTTFDVTDRLSLTGGIRWTEDEKNFSPDQSILEDRGLGLALVGFPLPAGLPLMPPGDYQRKFREWTPHLSAAYNITNDVMAYLSYSRGFKSGGFQQRAFPPINNVPSFEPETATTYEAGLKTTLLENRLRFNAAIFQTDYDDLQVDAFTSVGVTVTQNAAKARIRGGEAEFVLVPVQGLTLQGSLGYIDAKYLEISPEVEALGTTLDNMFANTPKWSWSLSAAYEVLLGSYGSLTPRVDFSYRSEIFTRAQNNPVSYQGGFGLVNAAVTYDTPYEGFSVTAGAKNLTNKTYLISAYDATGGVVGSAEALYSRPREWFLTLNAEF